MSVKFVIVGSINALKITLAFIIKCKQPKNQIISHLELSHSENTRNKISIKAEIMTQIYLKPVNKMIIDFFKHKPKDSINQRKNIYNRFLLMEIQSTGQIL